MKLPSSPKFFLLVFAVAPTLGCVSMAWGAIECYATLGALGWIEAASLLVLGGLFGASAVSMYAAVAVLRAEESCAAWRRSAEATSEEAMEISLNSVATLSDNAELVAIIRDINCGKITAESAWRRVRRELQAAERAQDDGDS